MNTPAYRPPIDTKTKESKESSDPTSRVEQIKHKFRYEILLQGIQLSTSYGMLLGGLDKLWSFASNTAGRLVQSPDSFKGRVSRMYCPVSLSTETRSASPAFSLQLISNALYAASILAINSLINVAMHRIYTRLSTVSVEDSYRTDRDATITAFARVWYMRNKEKREQVLQWPDWKRNLAYIIPTIAFVGGPCLALISLYEWLGPRGVEPMAISFGVVGLSIV